MELLGLSRDYSPADIGRGALALFLGSQSCSCAGAKPAAIAAAVRNHYESHKLAGPYPGDAEDLRTSVPRWLRLAAADAPERFYEHPDKSWTIAPPGQTADPHRNFVTVDRRYVKKGEAATAELKERKAAEKEKQKMEKKKAEKRDGPVGRAGQGEKKPAIMKGAFAEARALCPGASARKLPLLGLLLAVAYTTSLGLDVSMHDLVALTPSRASVPNYMSEVVALGDYEFETSASVGGGTGYVQMDAGNKANLERLFITFSYWVHGARGGLRGRAQAGRGAQSRRPRRVEPRRGGDGGELRREAGEDEEEETPRQGRGAGAGPRGARRARSRRRRPRPDDGDGGLRRRRQGPRGRRRRPRQVHPRGGVRRAADRRAADGRGQPQGDAGGGPPRDALDGGGPPRDAGGGRRPAEPGAPRRRAAEATAAPGLAGPRGRRSGPGQAPPPGPRRRAGVRPRARAVDAGALRGPALLLNAGRVGAVAPTSAASAAASAASSAPRRRLRRRRWRRIVAALET